jgi:hypothetical protein
MKRVFALVISLVGSVSAASAGDVKVEVRMTTGPENDPATWFTATTPKLYAMFKTTGAKDGDKLRGVLIAEDVGDAAPLNTAVREAALTLDGDTEDGDFNFSKPTAGWPTGKYRIEVYVNDELAATAKFTIKPSEKSNKENEGKSDDSEKPKDEDS